MNQPAMDYPFPPNIEPSGDYYHHPDHGPLVRVTKFLRAYGGKTETLKAWAERMERAACIKAAHALYHQASQSISNFGAAVESRLGGARASVKAMEAAGDIGTAIHRRIKFDLRGEEGTAPVLNEGATIGYLAWRKWWEGSGITPVRSEQTVYSVRLKAAGTVDIFGLRDGKLGILDPKSSTGIYEDQHLQLTAYVMMSRELGLPVEWAELIHLPKTLENAFKPIVPIPLGELHWFGGKPQRVVIPYERLEKCVQAIRWTYRTLMEER